MPLPLTVLHVFAPLYYGQVGVEKAVPHSAHEIKAALEPALVEIVKKQPAHAPGLTAMPIVKIVIAPLLVAGVDLGAKGFAGLAGNAMPVPTVLFKAVVGGQVVAAAKPPDRLTAGPLCHEEAHIGMAGGHVGIAGMDDQGDAHGLKAAAGKLRALRRCRGRQGIATDVGEPHPGLLEHASLAQHPASTPATTGALPVILAKRLCSIHLFQGGTDVVLQAQQILSGRCHGRLVHVRSPACANKIAGPASGRRMVPFGFTTEGLAADDIAHHGRGDLASGGTRQAVVHRRPRSEEHTSGTPVTWPPRILY